MERKLKKLTDVCSIQYGYAFSSKLFSDDSDNIAVIRIRNVKEGYSTTFYSGEYDEAYVINPGEILIGMDGEFNIAKWKSDPALLNQRVCKITGNDKVVEDYLQYYLSVELKEIERKTSFVTVKHLSAKALNAMELHLHPYDEQEKIANQLNLLRQIIDNRKVQLQEYDHLIKSRFVELFGDPVKNPKEWAVMTLVDVCTKLTDGTHHSPENRPSGDYKYITAKNIKKSGIDLSNISYVSKDDHENIYSRCNPELGDVLYIKDGVTTGIATVNTLNEEFSLLSSVALLKHDRSIMNEYFICGVLNSTEMYNKIRLNMGGAAITRLTITKLKEIKLPVPPLDLQYQYSDFVQHVGKLKVEVQKSLDETQVLFDSLMQEYFE